MAYAEVPARRQALDRAALISDAGRGEEEQYQQCRRRKEPRQDTSREDRRLRGEDRPQLPSFGSSQPTRYSPDAFGAFGCFIPEFDGAIFSSEWKEALWAKVLHGGATTTEAVRAPYQRARLTVEYQLSSARGVHSTTIDWACR